MADVDIGIHAAAMKHVDVVEYNPVEAVETNVLGTQHVIETAIDAGVERVLLTSSDIAVDSDAMMGQQQVKSIHRCKHAMIRNDLFDSGNTLDLVQ